MIVVVLFKLLVVLWHLKQGTDVKKWCLKVTEVQHNAGWIGEENGVRKTN